MDAKFLKSLTILILSLAVLTACQEDEIPLKTVQKVDLERFMGDWHVVAIIPNFIERNAVNGVESYTLNEDGHVDIRYTFRIGDATGKKKEMTAKGFIYDTETNAEWRVQFLWPFKLPYLVIDLDPEYRYTVIGVPNRKYAWVMSRKPEIDSDVYEGILQRMESQGYDVESLKKMPQIRDGKS